LANKLTPATSAIFILFATKSSKIRVLDNRSINKTIVSKFEKVINETIKKLLNSGMSAFPNAW
jgi:hypothetical protein